MRARTSECLPRLIKAVIGCALAMSLRCALMIFRFIRAHRIWSLPPMDGALPFLMTAFRFGSSLRKSPQSRLTCSVCGPLLPDICNLDLWTRTAKVFIAVKTRPRAHCSRFGCTNLRATKSKSLLRQQPANRWRILRRRARQDLLV